jgi:hypothetical protein
MEDNSRPEHDGFGHECAEYLEDDLCRVCWSQAVIAIRGAVDLDPCPICNAGGMVAPGDYCGTCGGFGVLDRGPITATTLCVCGHTLAQHDEHGVCQETYIDMEPGRVYSAVELDLWTGPTLLCSETSDDPCPGFRPAPPCQGCGMYDGEGGCSVCGS